MKIHRISFSKKFPEIIIFFIKLPEIKGPFREIGINCGRVRR